ILALEEFPDNSVTTIYLSGSAVNGFGNPWSDIDVFVISERKPFGPFAKHADTNDVSQHYVGQRRVDFEFWRPDHVRDVPRRLSSCELGSCREIERTTFTFIEECFIHRLRIGVPILNPQLFAGYQTMFDYQHFSAYQTQEVIRHLDSVLEDICGMMENNDLD